MAPVKTTGTRGVPSSSTQRSPEAASRSVPCTTTTPSWILQNAPTVSAMSVWSAAVISRLSLFMSGTRETVTPRSSSEASITSSTATLFSSTPRSAS